MNSIFDYTKYYLFFIVVVFIVTSCGSGGGTQYDPISDSTITVVEVTEFNNDFNNLTGLNTTAPQAPYANESQTYNPNNVSIVTSPSATANSVNTLNYSTQSTSTPETYLQILATTNSGTVTSGYVSTQGFQEFQYGRVEARIKIPNNTAVVPRFSLIGESFSTTVNIPTAGALDIMQVGSDTKTITPQLYGANPSSTPVLRNESLADGFRVYSVDWTTDKMIVKESGTVLHTFDIANDPRFQQEFFVALSIGVPTGNTLVGTATMLVDWLKVYPNETQDNTGFLGDDNSTKVSATTVETTNSNVSVNTSANNVGGVTPLQGDSYIALDFNTTEAGAGAILKVNATDYSQKTNVNFAINTSQMSNLASMKVIVYDTNSSATISISEITPAVVTADTGVANNVNNSNPFSTLNTSSGTTDWNNYSIPLRNFTQANNTFDFSNFTGIGFSDPVDANGQPVTGSLLVDNLQMAETILIGLPLDFELSSSSYNLSEANGGGISIVDILETTDGVNESKKVIKITQSADNAEVSVLLDSPIDLSSNKYFTLKVKASRATPIELTLQNPDNPSQTGSVVGQYRYPNTGAWEEVLFDFSNVANAVGSNAKKIIIKFDNGSPNGFASTPANWTFYADDLEQYATIPDDVFREPSTAPLSPSATRTISIYSDAYTDIPRDLTQDNGQTTILTEKSYGGNNVLKLKDFDHQVIDFQDNKQDITAYDKFYFNYWTHDIKSFNSFLISIDGVTTEAAYPASTSLNSWQSVDIDTSHFADGGVDLTKISQLKFDTSHTPTGIVYLDNIYFYDSSSVPPFEDGLLTNGDFQSGVNSWSGNPPGGLDTKDDGANKYFYANPPKASANPYDINLQQVVEIINGKSYTLTFKAKSDRTRAISAGIGLNKSPWTNVTNDVTLKNEWQSYTLEFTSNFGDSNSRVFFDMGAAAGEVSIDDVALFAADSTTPTPDTNITLPVGFEQAAGSYTVTGFDGGSISVKANPQPNGINTSGNVAEIIKGPGETWAGSFLTLDSAIDFNQGKVFKVKAWSSQPRTLLLQLGNSTGAPAHPNQIEVEVNHPGGSQWEELTFDFSAKDLAPFDSNGGAVRVVFIMDNGTNGGGGADWTMYIDDITQEVASTPTPDTNITLPVGFEQAAGSYTVTGFDGGSISVKANPQPNGINTSGNVAEIIKGPGETWAGSFLTLDSAIDFNQGKVFKVKAWSSQPRTLLLQLGNSTGAPAHPNQIEVEVNHPGGSQWEELTFDFSAKDLAPFDSNGGAVRVVFIMDNGTNGGGGADWTMYIDDITQEVASTPTPDTNITLPVGFEQAAGSYTVTGFDGGSISVKANPQPNGINTSGNVAEIIKGPGETWAGSFLTLDSAIDFNQGKVFKVKAWSSQPRTLLLQLGNSTGAPAHPNQIEVEVNHPGGSQWEELTFDFSAKDLAPFDSNGGAVRVVFIMDNGTNGGGGADWTMYIDDITQEVASTPTPDTNITLPVGFEQAAGSYTVTGFDGGSISVKANPQPNGINTSGNVAEIIKGPGETWAGSFLTLDSAIDFNQGKVFKVKAWSSQPRTLLLQLGNSTGAPAHPNQIEVEVNHPGGSQWEELTFDFSAKDLAPFDSNGGAVRVVFIMDNGTNGGGGADWTMYIDDITQEVASTPTPDTNITLPVGFEQAAGSYTVTGFDGGSISVKANPQPNGINTSGNVAEIIKGPGETWAGSFLTLDSAIDFNQGKVFKVKAWSSQPRTLLLQLGNSTGAPAHPNQIEVEVNHPGGSQWEELTFDFSAKDLAPFDSNGGAVRVVFIMDNGTNGGGGADWTMYIDDITQEVASTPTPDTNITLPVGFEQAAGSYTVTGFDGGSISVKANPQPNGINTSGNVAEIIKGPGETWAGSFLTLDSAIDFNQGKVFKVKAWSSQPRTLLLQLGNSTGAPAHPNQIEVEVNHPGGSQWEELTFDFSAKDLAPFDSNGGAVRVVFIMDNGTNGGGGADWTMYIDDITQEVASTPTPDTNITLPVGFEQAAGSYTVTGFDGGSISVKANPQPNGINTSGNVAEIIKGPGETWAGSFLTLDSAIDFNQGKVFKVKAWSSQPRTLLLQLGNSTGAPAHPNQIEVEVNHPGGSQWEELTFDFSAKDLAPFDSNGGAVRVVFIMDNGTNGGGGADWTMYIDDITQEVASTPTPTAPTDAPAAPTQAAADVISIFSDAYQDVTNAWNNAGGWGAFNIAPTDVNIASNALKKGSFDSSGAQFIANDFSSNKVDGSVYTHFRLDFWVGDADVTNKVFNLKLSNHENGTKETNALEYAINTGTTPAITSGQWISVDLPISNFNNNSSSFGSSDLAQFVITSSLSDVYIDNIYFYKGSATPTPDTNITLPVGFEQAAGSYTVTGFDGGSISVKANPQPNGINTSGNVAEIIKGPGETWAGSFLTLDSAIDFNQGKVFKVKAWSSQPRTLLLQLGNSTGAPAHPNQIEVEVNHPGGSQWEELTFDFSAKDLAPFDSNGGAVRVVFIMDNGTNGGGGADWTMYIDDITQEVASTPTPDTNITLPVGFEQAAGSYTVTGFDGGSISVKANPQPNGINTSGNVAEIIKGPGETWAGSFLTLDSAIDFNQGKVFKVKAWSSQPRTLLLQLGNSTGAPAHPNQIEVEVNHPGGSQWEELTFDFSAKDLAPFDSNGGAVRVVFIMDNGTNGGGGADWTMYIDDITQEVASTPTPTAPTDAPAAPTQAAADVISIFSDAYQDVTNAWNNAGGWGAFNIAPTDVNIASNALKKGSFDSSGAQFIANDFSSNKVDGSVYTHFRLDFWVGDADVTNKVFNLKLSNHENGTKETNALEYAINTGTTPAITSGQWISVDLPISNFNNNSSSFGSSDLAQFVITSSLSDVYIDNIYFYKGSATPTPDTNITLPVGFEQAAGSYTVTGFDGGSISVKANPQPNGINTSGNVAEIIKGPGETWAGSFLTLDSAIDFNQGKVFKVKAWSSQPRTLLLQLGNSTGAPAHPNQIEVEVNHPGGSQWEELTFDFSAKDLAPFDSNGGAVRVVFIMDNGTNGGGGADWTMYIDDITQEVASTPTPDTNITLPVGFEQAAGSYTVTGFDGGSISVKANPQPNGINTSGNVAEIIKGPGETWAGSFLTLDSAIDFNQGKVFKVKAWSSQPRTLLLQLGNSTGAPAHPNQIEVEVNHPGGSQWEELTFDFSAKDLAPFDSNGGAVRVVFIMDNGTNGGGGADWTMYIDDITQEVASTPTPDTNITLPVGFEQAAGSYTVTGFDGGSISVKANPQPNGINTSGNVAEIIKGPGETWAGSFLTLDSAIDFNQGKVFKVKAWSSQPRTLLLQLGNSTGAPAHPNQIEVEVNHPGGSQWEELTFDFSAKDLAPFDSNGGAVRVVFIMDNGTNGGGGADWTMYIDDITQEVASTPTPDTNITLPVGFEQAAGSYTVTGFDGGSISVKANPQPNGINTSGNVAEIIKGPGETWAGSFLTLDSAIDFNQGKVFKVKAWSSQPRTLLLQLGNSTGAPAHPNQIEVEVNHPGGSQWEELTFDFSAKDLAPFDSNGGAVRVVFIMDNGTNGGGGADWTMYIDDITQEVASTPTPTAPTDAPAAPTQAAADVISIFSDAYQDVTNAWNNAGGWGAFNIAPTDVNIASNALKKGSFDSSGAQFIANDFSSNKVDGSVYTHFRLDFWVGDADVTNKVFNLKLSNHENGTKETNALEYAINTGTTPAITSGQWISVDLPISNFNNNSSSFGSSDLAQFVITSSLSDVYIDNIYFYKADSTSDGGSSSAMNLSSNSYSNGGEIPTTFACVDYSGSNFSPHYAWNNIPTGASSFALIMDDETSPCGSGDEACVHWNVFNIPFGVTSFAENINISELDGVVEGYNYALTQDYEGPCPPTTHEYKTTIYALNADMPNVNIGLDTSFTRSQFESTYANNIVGSATYTGMFTVTDSNFTPPGEIGAIRTLIWSDEFNNSTLDTSNWNYETGYGLDNSGWGNNERQNYTDSPDNLSIENDPNDPNNKFLKITARCSDGNCAGRDGSVTSARINTKGNFSVQYGWIEARIKVPNGDSTWPAFWMLGNTFNPTTYQGWPESGEIDIMEVSGKDSINKSIFAMHWEDNVRKSVEQRRDNGSPLSDDFHVYAMEWDSTKITGYIDGIQYFEQDITSDAMSEFHQEFFLILNIAIGGRLGGTPNQIKTTPQEMLVDWVRVYQ